MKLVFLVLFLGLSTLIGNAWAHGVGSETLPPQMIENYNSTVNLKIYPLVPDLEIQEKQLILTIYDVSTDEHMHNMEFDLVISKNDQLLFSDTFRIEEGTVSLNFAPEENLGIEEEIENIFEEIIKYESNQIHIKNDVFSEGGLYDFDITIKSVDSFDNRLENPVSFRGSLSIPTKYEYEIDADIVSITTYYDVIDSFSFSSDAIKFLMPFDWSEENISQVVVIHEEVHIPKSLSSWIASDYDLQINGIKTSDSLITIDDYSNEQERIIHFIIPQQSMIDFKDDLQQMSFELKPNPSPDLPLFAPTTNNEYDVYLWWHPENLVWEENITFELELDEIFTPNKKQANTSFKITMIQDDQVIFEKTIHGKKNIKTQENSFEFFFDKSNEGSVKMLVSDIGSNTFADTEFVFVVNAPTLKFPVTIPSQTTEETEGSYDVDFTWIPADLLPDEESEFIFTIYEKGTNIPVFDAYYEFVLIQNNEEIFRKAGNAPAGGYFENFVFSEEHGGQVLVVRLDKINNSDEYAEISVNVVPEFGLISLLVLSVALLVLLVIPRNAIYKIH